MKKLLCLFLAVALLFIFVACNEGNDHEETSATTASGDSTESDDGRPDIPAKDMDGKVFTVLCTSWTNFAPLDITDIYVEASSEDGIESVTYNRMLFMQDKYNCDVKQHDIVSGQELQTILAANRSGDVPYEFGFVRSQNFAALVTAGALCELGEIPYIDYENPWWHKQSYDSLSILGKHFGVASSLTVNDELSTWVTYFNKRMIEDNELENPYELVNDKKWTYEKLLSMAQVGANDVNSDGVMNAEDIFGISHTRDTVLGMFNSAGVYIAKNNDEGVPEFTFTDEASVTKITDILTKIYRTDVCINLHNVDTGLGEAEYFMNGKSMFSFSGVYSGTTLRNMNEAYGIIPYPMYDENQGEYYSSTSGLFLSLMVVPNGNGGLEELGMFLEDFAWYGYKYITPEFYDILLSQKVAYDDESREMLDIIFGSMIYDTGNIGNYGNLAESLIWLTSSYNKNLASFIGSEVPAAQKKIENLIRAVERWS